MGAVSLNRARLRLRPRLYCGARGLHAAL